MWVTKLCSCIISICIKSNFGQCYNNAVNLQPFVKSECDSGQNWVQDTVDSKVNVTVIFFFSIKKKYINYI